MKLHGAEIVDTFAEAFPMWGARVVITAATPAWALEAGRSMTGFATSVIGCKCEASIERELDADETPDGRPGVSALLFAMDQEGVGKRLVERVGQTVLTCPDDGVLQRPGGRGHRRRRRASCGSSATATRPARSSTGAGTGACR